MEKICAYCQKLFVVKRIDSVYCSRSCRQMAYMGRKMNLLNSVNKIKSFPSEPKYEAVQTDSSMIKQEVVAETTIDGSLQFSKEVSLIQETKKPTSDVSQIEKTEIIIQVAEPVFIQSKFVNELIELNNDRPQLSGLNSCLSVKQDLPSYYVSVRLRCLVECLLIFSEMKYTHVADLMEICNAFTCIIRSTYFKTLPGYFPYSEDIIRLKEKLKRICILVQHSQQIKFRFRREDKLELIMIRYELAQFVSKKQFKQLDFQP